MTIVIAIETSLDNLRNVFMMPFKYACLKDIFTMFFKHVLLFPISHSENIFKH